jgi:hypothetical protein
VVTAIIMAIITPGYLSVGKFLVAVGTVQLNVDLIELQARNGVAEICLVPAAVAIGAGGAEFVNLPPGRVAGAATETLVEPVQHPVTITGMCKGRFLPGIMTLVARVRLMAVVADGVNLLVGFVYALVFLKIMTVTAVLLFVAANTTQPE